MAEHATRVRNKIDFSVRILGLLIILINLVLFYLILLIIDQKNVLITLNILSFFQNIAILVITIVFLIFIFYSKFIEHSVGTEKIQSFIVYFSISLLIGLIAIVLHLIPVPVLEPTFDSDSYAYLGIVVLQSGITILNLIIFYLGVKKYLEWLGIQQNISIPNTMNLAILASIVSACSGIVLYLLQIFVQINYEFFNSEFFNANYLLIPLLIIAPLSMFLLGCFLGGLAIEAVAGFELITIKKKQRV